MALDWQIATLIEGTPVAKNIKSLKFAVPNLMPHIAGQHYDLRLTAEDGYQTERSYSIASAPEEKEFVEFGVELLENGEVSPYLFSLYPGDQIEMRGPIGGSFIWNTSMDGPLCLIGGGSGMVPLMSMLRHHVAHRTELQEKHRKIIFLASLRTQAHLLYFDELRTLSAADPNLTLVFTFTELPPPNWDGYRRRIDHEMLKAVFNDVQNQMSMIYICGPTAFAEAASSNLIDIGFNPHSIRIERFGGAPSSSK